MKSLVSIAVAFIVSSQASAMVHHNSVKHSAKNIEVWCGATSIHEKAEFPYLAAVREYKTKKGAIAHVAEVYKGRHVVFRQFVFKNDSKNGGVDYLASGELFTLKIPASAGTSQFSAIIPDGRGDKMISNGDIQCHKAG